MSLSAVVRFLLFLLLYTKRVPQHAWQHIGLSSKLFLTLVVTKLSDLTRTSPGPCVPAVERAEFACRVAYEDGTEERTLETVWKPPRHEDEI